MNEVNKCKILLSVLLFSLLSVFGNAQQYFVNEYAYYRLDDSVHFTFGQTGFCGSAPTGRGTYTKKGNKITFQFSPKITSPKITLTEYPTAKNTGDDFKIRIICKEDSVNSFPFVNLYYLDSMNKKIGSYTDVDGVCELKIKANNFSDTIFIRYPGIPNVDIPILSLSQIIEIILPFESPFEIHDKVEVFRIKGKDKLVPIDN
jgi:hypothetical protein